MRFLRSLNVPLPLSPWILEALSRRWIGGPLDSFPLSSYMSGQGGL
jgi:hypothetical protein